MLDINFILNSSSLVDDFMLSEEKFGIDLFSQDLAYLEGKNDRRLEDLTRNATMHEEFTENNGNLRNGQSSPKMKNSIKFHVLH